MNVLLCAIKNDRATIGVIALLLHKSYEAGVMLE
jgi:hypothetical protein